MRIPHIQPATIVNPDQYDIYWVLSKMQVRKVRRFNTQVRRHIGKIIKNLKELNETLQNTSYGSHRSRVALTNFYTRHARLVKRLNKELPFGHDPYDWVNQFRHFNDQMLRTLGRQKTEQNMSLPRD